MAYINAIGIPIQTSIFFETLKKFRAARAEYRISLGSSAALSRLTDRDLADIGLRRDHRREALMRPLIMASLN